MIIRMIKKGQTISEIMVAAGLVAAFAAAVGVATFNTSRAAKKESAIIEATSELGLVTQRLAEIIGKADSETLQVIGCDASEGNTDYSCKGGTNVFFLKKQIQTEVGDTGIFTFIDQDQSSGGTLPVKFGAEGLEGCYYRYHVTPACPGGNELCPTEIIGGHPPNALIESVICQNPCGNGVCQTGETDINCYIDCGGCGRPDSDGVTRCTTVFEDCNSCPADCPCCPVDGGWDAWSSWSVWGACSGGDQTQTRTKDCTNPAPACGGRNCTGCEGGTPPCPDKSTQTNTQSCCGNGISDPGENCDNCPEDTGGLCCGNGICDTAYGEDGSNCYQDCGSCGDGTCNNPPENTITCPQDCGTLCDDGVCNGAETTTDGPNQCCIDCGNATDGVCCDDPFVHEFWHDCCLTSTYYCSTTGVIPLCEYDSEPSCPDAVCTCDCGTCGDDVCCPQTETTATCWEDCGTSCGDGACNGSETVANCCVDCGDTTDGFCCSDPLIGEFWRNCCVNDNCIPIPPEIICTCDCASGGCGDGYCCASTGEDGNTCPADCPIVCGDGACSTGEDIDNCCQDCGSGLGDGKCCAADGEDLNSACQDCQDSDPLVACGDGKCCAATGEDENTCCEDCGSYGDGICCAESGETIITHCKDCGNASDGFCCYETCEMWAPCCSDSSCPGVFDPDRGCSEFCTNDCGDCGDGFCDPVSEQPDPSACCSDCASFTTCGDGLCQCNEDASNCYADCGVCGDGTCTEGEENCLNCPADCICEGQK